MSPRSVLLCFALMISLAIVCQAFAPRGDGTGRRRRGDRFAAPCLRLVEVDGENTTTFNWPCAFSTQTPETEASLFQCVGACRHSGDVQGQYTSYCRPRRCSVDSDCYGDSTCVTGRHGRGRCTSAQEYINYVKACKVVTTQDPSQEVHSHGCIVAGEECSSSAKDLTFTLEGTEYLAYYCHAARGPQY